MQEEKGAEGARFQRPKLCLLKLSRVQKVDLTTDESPIQKGAAQESPQISEIHDNLSIWVNIEASVTMIPVAAMAPATLAVFVPWPTGQHGLGPRCAKSKL